MDKRYSTGHNCRKFFSFSVLFCFILLGTTISFADDILENGLFFGTASGEMEANEDLDDFFEENPEPEVLKEDSSDLGESNYSLNGNMAIKAGYRFNHDPPMPGATDQRGLSDLKGKMDLEFKRRFFNSWEFLISGSASYNLAYELNNSNNYTDKFLDEDEKQIEFDELFIRGSLAKALDIKAGRQIVVWGKSDNIRITDILNPLDLREIGMTDIEDLRLPVFMTRLDYYFSEFSFSGILIHEHRSNTLPVFGSSYYFAPSPIPDDTEPCHTLENTGFAISLSGSFPGMDIAFYMADTYDNMPYLTAENLRLHERIFMAGLAINKVYGNFLYKVETALFDGIRLSAFRQNGALTNNFNEYTRFDFLAGIEYWGFQNASLSFEIADKWLTDFDDAAQKSQSIEHLYQYALRASKTFFHDILDVTILASFYGETGSDGGFIRVQGAYELSDALTLTLGSVFYQSGSSLMLKKIGENDVVFANLKYSF